MLTIPSSTRTMATPSQNGTWNSSCAASPPKSPTRASQAIDDSHCTVPGRTMVFPNGSRPRGTWAVPVCGPQLHRMATGRAPMIVPTMMATSPSPNPSPSTTARVPVNTPDSSILGVNHTVNIRCTPPYLESAGIGAMPWLSSARSPVRVGRTPSKTLSSSVASAMAHPSLDGAIRCLIYQIPSLWSTVRGGTQLRELTGEGFRAPVRVEATGIGQHPYLDAAEGLILWSHTGARAAERRPVGGDTDDRQPPGTQPRGLRAQRATALAQLLRAQFVRPGRGAGDDVGEAEPEVEKLFLLVRTQQARRERGPVRRRSEAVPRAGEVVPGGGGVQARVDAREQHPQVGRRDIGDRPVSGRRQVSRRRPRFPAHCRHPRSFATPLANHRPSQPQAEPTTGRANHRASQPPGEPVRSAGQAAQRGRRSRSRRPATSTPRDRRPGPPRRHLR